MTIGMALGLLLAASPFGGASADARCAVWNRELGFAASVAAHDAKDFADHVQADAVFGVNGPQPTRGREAIVAEWKGIIDGSAVELRWYPDTVSVAADGRTAYSSGPALFRDAKSGSYHHSRFGSVWQLGEDGQWRVIFDGGSRPQQADEAAVKAFEAGRRECPSA